MSKFLKQNNYKHLSHITFCGRAHWITPCRWWWDYYNEEFLTHW